MHFCVDVPNIGLWWQHGCTQLCYILCTGSMGVLSFATYCVLLCYILCTGSMGVLSFATYCVLAAWVYSALLHTVYCTGSMGVLSFATYCLPQPKSTPGARLHWLVSGQRSLKPSLTSKSVSDYNTKKEKSGKPWELAIHGACKVHPHTAACAALPLHTNPHSSPPHWHCCTHSSNTLPTNDACVHAETLLQQTTPVFKLKLSYWHNDPSIFSSMFTSSKYAEKSLY